MGPCLSFTEHFIEKQIGRKLANVCHSLDVMAEIVFSHGVVVRRFLVFIHFGKQLCTRSRVFEGQEMNGKLLTKKEVAELLQISQKKVQRLVAERKLRATRVGYRTLRFRPEDVNRCIDMLGT